MNAPQKNFELLKAMFVAAELDPREFLADSLTKKLESEVPNETGVLYVEFFENGDIEVNWASNDGDFAIGYDTTQSVERAFYDIGRACGFAHGFEANK